MTDHVANESLRDVRTADVYKSGVLAARLERGADGVLFSYRDDYLSSTGPSVATTLPKTEPSLVTPSGAVPPFFAGLLPEGRRLLSLRRAVKTSADDEFTLLLAVGRDAVGDVQVVVAGEEPSAASPRAEVDRDWSEIRFTEVLADAGVVDPIALPGVQDKTSARMISVPVRRRGERYMLKVDPPELAHLVLNEEHFLRQAAKARIAVASAEVVHDADGRPGLLIRRFDRLAMPDGTTRALPCEDGCQVMGRWPADKYNLSAEEVVAALTAHTSARPVAIRALFQQLCFAWLTGNGDVHAKNLSILADERGEWRVAPAYDLPSTVPYGDLSMALSMVGRRTGFARRHLLEFADAIELPNKAAVKVLDDLLVRLDGLEDDLRGGTLPFDENTCSRWAREIRHRGRQAAG